MQPPRALIFDVFGTVVDWRTSVARVVKTTIDAKGIKADATAFADYWRSRYDPAMETIRSGSRGYVPLDDIHLENLHDTLVYFGLENAFADDERALLNKAWEQLDPWPDSVAGLKAIKERVVIAPCSNGSIALMTRLARYGSLPWDCILGAELARNYKPEPAVYRACCAALRLSPEQVMMVAAHNSDLEAAARVGLQTCFIPRPTEHGPGQTKDLTPTGDWTFVATSLNDKELHRSIETDR